MDGLEWCGLLVDYCDVFISCLDSHASDVMLHFSKSDEVTNASTFWMVWVLFNILHLLCTKMLSTLLLQSTFYLYIFLGGGDAVFYDT